MGGGGGAMSGPAGRFGGGGGGGGAGRGGRRGESERRFFFNSVSSAKGLKLLTPLGNKSFVNVGKSTGPSMDPCGMPPHS